MPATSEAADKQNMVGILLVTHGDLGGCMLKVASQILGREFHATGAVTANFGEDPAAVAKRARALIGSLDDGQGVLVMSDLFGSTPGNASKTLLADDGVQVLWGVNMPMLLRALDYRDKGKNLAELAELAFTGCIAGVLKLETEHAC